MVNLKSIKTQLILYLASFALFLAIKERNIVFFFSAIVTVISALATEAVFLYFKTGSLQITESAIITGLIVSFVISSGEPFWKLISACVLAIISKYFIRFQNRHIFNPAAFGIFLAFILFGVSLQWKATFAWYILVPFGIYFINKIKKMEVLIGYALISLFLFGTQAFLQRISLLNIFGYFSYFYIFVMVIEPRTTPTRLMGKLIFGAGIAILIFILTEAGAKFDVELFSLLMMNAVVPLLNKLSPRKEGAL